MKRIMYGVLLVLGILFLYHYQKPILTTEEAVVQAYDHLKNPPQGAGIEEIQLELRNIPADNIQLKLHSKEGFFNEWFNKKQWEVTIEYQSVEPTVVIDAYTGKLVEITGPLN